MPCHAVRVKPSYSAWGLDFVVKYASFSRPNAGDEDLRDLFSLICGSEGTAAIHTLRTAGSLSPGELFSLLPGSAQARFTVINGLVAVGVVRQESYRALALDRFRLVEVCTVLAGAYLPTDGSDSQWVL